MKDNKNKKLKKIEKELNKASKLHKAQSVALKKASKMHKSQADRISKMTNEDNGAMEKSKKGMAMYGKKMNQESLNELVGLFEELCKKGKAYRAKRMRAGEKSSAYLSGRAVKVCKGQMQGEGEEIEEHTVTFTKDEMAKLHNDGEVTKADDKGKDHTYKFNELSEYYVDSINEHEEYCPVCTEAMLKTVKEALNKADGCEIYDSRENGGYCTPIDATDKNETFISRIREDKTNKNSLNLWIVSDNLLRGAALNSVEIAETVIKYSLYEKQ